MRFTETSIPGVWIVDLEPVHDERGFFARTWCPDELGANGLDPALAQCSISFTRHPGTLRGMHYQEAPHAEVKLVRCTRGTVYDVALDLRPGSATFRQWTATELSGENRRALYIPEGCAHGLQTLEPDCEVLYHISTPHTPGAAKGVRWDDPAFDIRWPLPHPTLSDRDRSWPDFRG
jgi:dTDP-4-dehydrorhamnose 3,5-epimerase